MTRDFGDFVQAQQGVSEQVTAELVGGRKTTHWMWFVFPQLAGLGRSEMARRFALGSLEEAEAYWRHPVLGTRLLDCTRLVNELAGRSIHEIFGSPDDLKFHSSMTLFAHAVPDEPRFAQVLARYCDGAPDPLTLALLA